jgi:hypothetical protein
MKANRRTGRDTCCRKCLRYTREAVFCIGDRSPCHADPDKCYGMVTHQPTPQRCRVCPPFKEAKP